ncbi:MAG: aminotransferase class III-fold pyridoxal phosphate-dependent enzyme, partial [Pseudomonadota bacterium]
ACLATEAVAAPMTAGTHGSTFGGNPLATAVGNALLDEIMAPGFMEQVRERSARLQSGLDRLVERHPSVLAGHTGMGLMIGLNCVIPNAKLLDALLQQRMLVVKAGGNTLRLLPPLNVSTEEIDRALEILDTCCDGLRED